ncbi:MAG: class I tRNA ligase family protein, partial [Alphaproteobacteria bacterium]|nr:class I tRNA ligase family protein [Alphaproteobacteria bacterium]
KCKWQSISMVEDKKYSSQAIKEKILVSGLSDHRAAMHPLYVMGDGADKKSGKINIGHADFVTADAGTGFVHIAPDHGKDDFNFYKTSVSVYDAAKVSEYVSSLSPYYVSKEGYYRRDSAIVEKITHDIPELEKEGVRIYDEQGKDGGANQAVIDALKRTNALVGIENYKHSYPHSWRSKAPVIFLATPQWFIEMDKSGDSPGDSLRQKSLAALQDVASYPANGKNTLTDMIANRPDWCISRQRTWGVPLPLFFYRDAIKTFILKDPTLVHKVKEVFTEQGADAWFDEEKYPDSFWLEGIKDDQGKAVDPNQWQKLKDVVDVWFDSGSTHGFVLEQRPELQSPADMYLEGIDQHRGWFHSSLLESVATRGRAPYKSLLTHGFVLDEKGNKMSKSLGNVVAPAEVIKQYGADILRLWVVASDYSENLLIGKNILAQHSESYRRVRNTFRWLLGVLNSSDKHFVAEGKQPEQMPAVDRYILHCLTELDIKIRAAITHYEFDKMFRALFTFCDSDLSAFYFDVRKDVLYCHAVDSVERRAAIFVIDTLHNCLCRWFAPILCFTAEEAWHTHPRHQQRHGDQDSIHLHDFPDITAHGWLDESLAKNIRTMIGVRKEVLQVLEQARKEKKIGSSLDAQIQLTLPA